MRHSETVVKSILVAFCHVHGPSSDAVEVGPQGRRKVTANPRPLDVISQRRGLEVNLCSECWWCYLKPIPRQLDDEWRQECQGHEFPYPAPDNRIVGIFILSHQAFFLDASNDRLPKMERAAINCGIWEDWWHGVDGSCFKVDDKRMLTSRVTV